MRDLLVVLVSLVVLAGLEALYHLSRFVVGRREAELKRRLRRLETDDGAPVGLLRGDRFAATLALDAFVRGLPGTAALERLLVESDSPWTVARLLSYSAAAALAGTLVPLAFHLSIPIALLIGGIAGAYPIVSLTAARSRRSARLSEQLPEALDMMSRSLRAGHALPNAFRLVAGEMPAPVSVELARAWEEQKLGLAAEEAVVNITRRCPDNRDLRIFAVSVLVQKETGGNLAEILENIASTIRDRYRFYSKLKALTAEGRTSGLVLGSLPIAMALFLAVANHAYFGRFFDNPAGQAIFVYAVTSWGLGGYWLWRMGQVQF